MTSENKAKMFFVSGLALGGAGTVSLVETLNQVGILEWGPGTILLVPIIAILGGFGGFGLYTQEHA